MHHLIGLSCVITRKYNVVRTLSDTKNDVGTINILTGNKLALDTLICMYVYSIHSPDRSTGIQNPNKLKVVLVVDLIMVKTQKQRQPSNKLFCPNQRSYHTPIP